MQDDRAELHLRRRTPSFPGGAQEDKRSVAHLDVHGHGSTPAGTDHNIGLVLVELGLGDADGETEIVIGENGV